MWTKSRSLLLSRIMTALFLSLLTAGAFGLPQLLRLYITFSGKSQLSMRPLSITLWVCVIPAFLALIRLGRMLKNITFGRVFVGDNVSALRTISWCCYLVSLIFFCFTFYYVLGLLLAILAAFMGLILRVLKNVFEQAIELKEENDLTI